MKIEMKTFFNIYITSLLLFFLRTSPSNGEGNLILASLIEEQNNQTSKIALEWPRNNNPQYFNCIFQFTLILSALHNI